MERMAISVVIFSIVAVTGLILGCSSQESAEKPAASPVNGMNTNPGKPEEHGHKPGTHGGIIVPLGRDSYHIEVVFTGKGEIRLFTLGKDEARLQEVDLQELTGFVTLAGATDATEATFTASPQKGDPAGNTTLFIATLPVALQGKTINVTINNIQIGGERFRFSFSNENASHEEASASADDEETRNTYRTPGGKYTAEDIRANGDVTPARKYQGIPAAHNAKPAVGDRICPVSMSKSNSKLTWVIGGKTYEFCCPPCIDEFVRTAKEKPSEILEPAAYIKK